jgi:hypothetical protein
VNDDEDIAELLRERYPLPKGDRIRVRAERTPEPRLQVILDSGRHRYEISVAYRRGANGGDPWLLAADALDALFGMFLESNRTYRELPSGEDVEYDGVFFDVLVEHTIPELEARAERLLEDENGSTPRKS